MIHFIAKEYSELSKEELHTILRLRLEVFVVEQNCPYQDIDNKDHKAIHIMGIKDNEIIAYSRIFKAKDCYEHASFGRVLVKKSERGLGYANELVQFTIDTMEKEFGSETIQISAQTYLKKFYKSHGFSAKGEAYLEDGIEHIDMYRN